MGAELTEPVVSEAWSQRLRALLDEENPKVALRASRGRAYERAGRVTDLRPVAGVLSARVQGSRATPYAVRIGMPVLDEAEWDTVSATVVEQVRHGARLLAGQVPVGLVQELEGKGVRLFPRLAELELSCGCDDPAPACKHMAAVIESVARRLDEDPFLLLRLRGRGRERLLADLAAARREVRREDEGEPVSELSPEGWATAPVALDEVSVPVAVAEPPLARRGDPPGWSGGVAAADLFGPLLERGAGWVAARPFQEARQRAHAHRGAPSA